MNIFVGIILLLAVWVGTSNNAGSNAFVAAASSSPTRLKFSKHIALDQGLVGLLEIYEGQEPVDAVFAFSKHYGLDSTQQHRLLGSICQSLACRRMEPVIWKKTVNIDGKWEARIEILRGQEPADIIFASLKPYGVTFEGRHQLFQEIKQANIPFTREHALVFAKNITLGGDESFSERLCVYDDGREPVDVLYEFVIEHSIEERFRDLSSALLSKLCEQVSCERNVPTIWQKSINNEDGKELGTLSIFLGQEPVDQIDQFLQLANVPASNQLGFRQNLLEVVCQVAKCTRTVPVVYRKSIQNERGHKIGSIEILEHEEVIDGTFRFLKSTTVADEIALKNFMLQDACANVKRVKCTRNVAVVFHRRFKREDGAEFNPLIIYENEEPADKVYQFLQNESSLEYYDGMIEIVCDTDGVKCARREPVYFSIPIKGPGGEHVNIFEIKVNEEPVDAMFKFFARNNLFKKKWDFAGIVSQICAKPNVPCRRHVPLKYLDRNFTMGGIDMGQIEIWGDQEVVDVLYTLRRQYNLTEADQVEKFSEICHKSEVYCERTKAIVYRKSEITKLDFEKFGNETCKRQFVGVKFRSSFVNMPFGGQLSDFLRKESSKEAVEHPLFCMIVLLVLQAALRLITAIPKVKKRINPYQRVVISFGLVIFVSVLQAVLVEPVDEVDEAFHTFDGKLPDLIILEGEEPVDALVKWGKEASKGEITAAIVAILKLSKTLPFVKVGTEATAKQEDWRPIVREPIYYELLDELCNEVDGLTCTRERAWEFLSMGGMTYFGQEYPIEIYNPMVDPIARQKCISTDGRPNSCIKASVEQICGRIHPMPNNCVNDIAQHIASQLGALNDKRLDAKCSYQRLELEIDAPSRELYKKAASIALSRGMNISPFRRVDNGTQPYYSWSKETAEAHAAMDTFMKVKSPEDREWNDKPCTPYFNGALCAKYDKEGNMKIEV